MAKAKDIFTDSGEIKFINGDLSISDNANYVLAECLFYSSKGEFKSYPKSGLNIRKYINSPIDSINSLRLQNAISQEFKNDGFSINDLSIKYNNKALDYVIKTNCDRIR